MYQPNSKEQKCLGNGMIEYECTIFRILDHNFLKPTEKKGWWWLYYTLVKK